jgi:hypothetical protein
MKMITLDLLEYEKLKMNKYPKIINKTGKKIPKDIKKEIYKLYFDRMSSLRDTIDHLKTYGYWYTK